MRTSTVAPPSTDAWVDALWYPGASTSTRYSPGQMSSNATPAFVRTSLPPIPILFVPPDIGVSRTVASSLSTFPELSLTVTRNCPNVAAGPQHSASRTTTRHAPPLSFMTTSIHPITPQTSHRPDRRPIRRLYRRTHIHLFRIPFKLFDDPVCEEHVGRVLRGPRPARR